jgi:filamentous hemagglutinin family protein
MKSNRTRKRQQRLRIPRGLRQTPRLGRKGARIGAAAILTGSFAIAQVPVYAGGALPVPCPGSSACANLAFDPLNTKAGLPAGIGQLVRTANTLTINQGSALSAIYNWASFNISAGNTVQFNQASASAVALNRIFDPNITTIAGTLKGNGQIYLVNPNGILFGSGANVNVGGLIASTLDIPDARITGGLLSNTNVADPVFSSTAGFGSTLAASPGANPSIQVQQGATLYAAGRNQAGTIVSAGRVFLFAPTVENAGTVTVDGGGQVILAAGSNVYLGSSSDPSLRGLLVEVSGTSKGVTIDPTGNITVARGNITLMGLAVNQEGSLTATSALDANGSIRLIAREADPTISSQDPDVLLGASVTGPVTLAPGSKTEVVLDPTDTSTQPLDDTTAAALKSTIQIQGLSVTIGGAGAPGSTIVQAHGGDITVDARTASSVNTSGGSPYFIGENGNLLGADNASSVISVGADALIDASGLQNVAVDGARYFTYIDPVTSSNLANAPYQRTGFLLGQGLYVNLLQAPSWLDVSNLLSAVAGTQAERNTVGGTVGLYAEGSVQLAKGSVVNVSGGSTYVTPAVGRTSDLVTASGSIVNIDSASADVQYVGFADGGSYTNTSTLEGINQTVSWQVPVYTQVGGYTAGAGAGTLQIYAPTAQVGGSLLGSATTAAQQRTTPVAGGLLQIGSVTPSNLDSEAGISRGSIVLTTNTATADALTAGISSGTPIVVDITNLQQGGFTRLDLTSDGLVALAPNSALDLAPGGSLTIRANSVAINSSISAPGGSVSIEERPLTPIPPGGDSTFTDEYTQRNLVNLITYAALRGDVQFAPGVQVSTAGLWTNDEIPLSDVLPTSPVVLGGGSISVEGRTVNAALASFDVSAGAWLSSNGTFTGGRGGSLSLTATNLGENQSSTPGASDQGVLELGFNFASRIQGYGTTAGGALSLYAPSITVGGDETASGSAISVAPAVGNRGFQTFKFSGFSEVAVAPGVDFTPQVQTVQFSPALAFAPSGDAVPSTALLQGALPGQAYASSISLSASYPFAGLVDIGAGSIVNAGIGGSIALDAGARVDIGGSLVALGGTVSAALALGSAPLSQFSLAQVNERAIVLEPGASIDAGGASLIATNSSGLTLGSVLAGGTVSLDAGIGTVALEAGATIDVSGSAASLDIQQPNGSYQVRSIASAGGTVEMSATNGVVVEGSIAAQGGSATVGGGQLSLQLDAAPANVVNLLTGAEQAQLTAPLVLTVTEALPALAAGTLSSFVSTANGGYIPASTITKAGFADVWLQSPDVIDLIGGQGPTAQVLTAPGAIVLAAPAIAVAPYTSFNVKSPYIALGPTELLASQTVNNGYSNNTPEAASGGTAALTVSGQAVDIVGNVDLVGIGFAEIFATGDVRGLGVPNANSSTARYSASLQYGGDLTIQASRLYPATQTDFAITGPTATPGSGSLQIGAVDASPATTPLLSAGGSLTISAGDIDIAGEVLAPLGSITIDASRTLNLEAGSLLSVAGSGVVPYGSVSNGTTWTYGQQATSESTASPVTIGSSAGFTVPAKGISLSAPSITASAGSTIDIAGGGDVQGTQFIAGPGGSYDYSQNFPFTTTSTSTIITSSGIGTETSTVTSNVRNPFFALIPSVGTSISPFDPQIFSNLVLDPALPAYGYAAFRIGATITIASGSPLPAGTYTIMPPAYALLPGAFAVESVAGYQNIQPGSNVSMPDGTSIVAGRIGDAAAGTIASQWSGFRVYDSQQFNTLSSFQNFTGTSFFDALATGLNLPLPRVGTDAGVLQIAASSVLLESTIDTQHAVGAQGAQVSLDVPNILVADTAPTANTPQATLTLTASMLDQLDAQTLVLGAIDTRTAPSAPNTGSSGTTATLSEPVASTSVTIESTQAITAGEIILAASSVDLANGAQLKASGTVVNPTTSLLTQGDGALLYLGSQTQLPAYSRTGASAPGTATVGDLSIGNAQLTGGSLVLDASQSQSYSTGVALGVAAIDLSAAVMNLGAVPSGTPGVDLTPQLLASVGNAQTLAITTLGGIDVYGDATLGQTGASGQPLLASLTLTGPGIADFGAAGTVLQINAGHLAFANAAGSTVENAGTGAGQLAVNATALPTTATTPATDGSVDVGGTIALSGFQSVAINAVGRISSGQTVSGTGDILFTGAAGASSALGLAGSTTSMEIAATRITAQSGVEGSISVPGLLSLSASGPGAAPQAGQFGASLQLTASAIEDSGRIDLPAGAVVLQTTGSAASDGITLASGALIRVAGSTQTFASTSADVAAGTITLSTVVGSITQNAGATLDVSGAGTSGDAGSLALLAPNGTVTLQGSLALQPGGQGRGAQLDIDAGNLADANQLIGAIASGAGGGALDTVSLRARTGDVTIGGGPTPVTLAANAISIEADGESGATDGSINVAGTLVASGASGGQIAMYANNQILLESGSLLDVHATGTGASAGSVLLSARVNANASAPTTLDAIVVQSGATLNLQGSSDGNDGTVTLQAPIAASGADVQIAPIPAGAILGAAASKIVNPIFVQLSNGALDVDAALMASEATRLTNFMSTSNVSAMTARLGFAGDPNFHIQPGLELISTGTMTVSDPIDFSTGLTSASSGAGTFMWRYGGPTLATSQPGLLVLRAGGDLQIQANISDGVFSTTNSVGDPADLIWQSGTSWSYVLTGGADLAASNPNQTVAGAGNLFVGNESEPGVVVRTGTGSINLNAGQDVVLNNGAGQQDNVVYTTGVNNVIAPNFPPFSTYDAEGNFVNLRPVLTQDGGSLSIAARGNVLGTAEDGSNTQGSAQTVNDWLWRYGSGTSAAPTAWWTDIDSFQQGFGVLGGGNLSIAAGGNIVRVGAAVPTDGYAIGTNVVTLNAGSLTVQAGGNLVQGLYYDEAGAFEVRAASLQSDVAFAQGSNVLQIVARDGAQIALPFNPTIATPSANLTQVFNTDMFFTYGSQSTLSVQVASGDLDFAAPVLSSAAANFFNAVPTNVQMVAFGGSIVGAGFSNLIDQYPDANGQLRLLAGSGISQIDWFMDQSDVSTLPTAGTAAPTTASVSLETPSAGAQPLHANDPTTAEIVALNGSITSANFNLAKTTEISAGNNIGPYAEIEIQNSNANSLSTIAAANQLLMTSGIPYEHIFIGGQGAAQIVSGSEMNLGTDGLGIESIGNLDNPRLPAQGATLIVAAGTGNTQTANGPVAASPDYLNVIDNFVAYDAFASSGSTSTSLDAQVLATLRSDDASLAPFVSALATGLANRAAALQTGSAFEQQLAQLSPAQVAIGAVKLASAVQVVANAQFVASSNKDTFAPGYAAFSDLFPNLTPATNVVSQFIVNNPFAAAAGNSTTLRTQALQGLPADFVAAVDLALSSPSQISQAGSAYQTALAAIGSAQLDLDARQLFANVLTVAGVSKNTLVANGQLTGSGSPYAKGLTSLAQAFTPTTPAGFDDLQMDYNEIKAEQTGSVAVFTPQGSVIVGQSSPPVLDNYSAQKVAAELGIFTLGGGDIIGMARDNFNVFQSRVFTVAGGNISLWSSEEDIDAGRGPRDVAVVAPPTLAVDPNTGIVYLDFSASVTGSGIGALETEADQPPSNINLIAPVGYVDAGEAGIRAQTGKVILGTNLVLNATNIQAASGVSGGAVVATPPPPPPPAANTSQSDRVAEELQNEVMAQQLGAQERTAASLRLRVNGEFVGFEKNCKSNGNTESDCESDEGDAIH